MLVLWAVSKNMCCALMTWLIIFWMRSYSDASSLSFCGAMARKCKLKSRQQIFLLLAFRLMRNSFLPSVSHRFVLSWYCSLDEPMHTQTGCQMQAFLLNMKLHFYSYLDTLWWDFYKHCKLSSQNENQKNAFPHIWGSV